MILELRLRNFYSIKDEVILDLRAGSITTKSAKALINNSIEFGKEKILKSIAIYGANASGKSNIIKSIVASCQMILNSHLYNENSLFTFKPFKFSTTGEPSYLFVCFVDDGVEYEYSFSMNTEEILSEELFYYPKGRRSKVFTRNESLGRNKKDIYSFSTAIKSPMSVADNTSKKSLYLSRASQMDRELPKSLYRFFNERFLLGPPALQSDTVLELFHANHEVILKAMQLADSDIVDIKIQKQMVTTKSISVVLGGKEQVNIKDTPQQLLVIKSYHRSQPSIAFDFETEESEGTKRLFYLLLSMLDVLKNGKTILIDEIDLHLHSHLTEFLVNLFHKSDHAQIIFTTHNTNLLDLKKIRKDQICFVNKNEKGISELYSLFDYKDFRDNMNLEKAYLQGRFDAVPIMSSSIDSLKDLYNE